MNNVTPAEARYLLGNLLRDVSRSFYLTLKVLPTAVRAQIGLAYLLARATDTIADTEILPVNQRLEALQNLRGAICEDDPSPDFAQIASHQSSAAEAILLQRVASAIDLLRRTNPSDRARIQRVLATITSGQELDMVRFRSGSASDPVGLETLAELDDYTWRVAGCVGEFWTDTCLAWLKPEPTLPREQLMAKGIQFGKGLQLVNILRDIPADLKNGRCYIPAEVLNNVQLTPKALLDPSNDNIFKPQYTRLLNLASDHLQAGWEYTLALPFSWLKVRLACAWPILIGQDTLKKLAVENVLDSSRRIKTKRREVRRILAQTIILYPWKSAWDKLGQSQPFKQT